MRLCIPNIEEKHYNQDRIDNNNKNNHRPKFKAGFDHEDGRLKFKHIDQTKNEKNDDKKHQLLTANKWTKSIVKRRE